MRIPWLRASAVGALWFSLGAQGADAVHVPEALDGWRDWVLHGHEYRNCPFLHDSAAVDPADFACAWPGRLAIEVDAEGGRFDQRWTIHGGEQWVALPGSAEHWPRDVTVDGRPASLVLRDERPATRLPVGEHSIGGRFAWQERPPKLAIPAEVGLVALTVDGIPVALPRRDDGLWLGAGSAEARAEDALAVKVFRLVVDDVPTWLDTDIDIDVSGSVREELLRPVLPPGFVPMTLWSDLPARLEGGALRLQVRPGSWLVSIRARADDVLAGAAMPEPESNMPATEVWGYESRSRLRIAAPEAPRPVDPLLVGAPWSDKPTFRLAPGDALAIVERSRGAVATENELALARDLWLDFDRRGFTFLDRIDGTMRTGWRLETARPYVLLAAKEGGRAMPITRGDGSATDGNAQGGKGVGAIEGERADGGGIEVRRRNVDVEALGRVAGRGEMPVSGWRANMAVATTLHLPPGNKLLAAFGVDEAPSSWMGRWRLLDFFVLLVVATATARLFGKTAGVVALLALALGFHESGAPVWTWLNLLAATALARVAPEGWLRRLTRRYRLASFALLLLFLVPFLVAQIRMAAYPQLEPSSHRRAETFGLFEMLAGTGPRPVTGSYIRKGDFPMPFEPSGAAGPSGEATAASAQIEEMVVSGWDIRDIRFDTDALTQTGPGRPAWEWAPHALSWSGPVDAAQTMRLVVAPPWLTSALRVLAAAALGLLAAFFAFDLLGRAWRWPVAWPASKRGATAAAAAVAVGLAASGPPAQAETPPAELLDELEERLLAPPSCVPECAEIVHANVEVGADDIVIGLRIHAFEAVAVPLPGATNGWLPSDVAIQGAPLATARRDDTLWARLDRGRHTVTLRGPLPGDETVEIPFPASPRAIAAASEHWLVTGIGDGALSTGSLSLTRLREDQDGEAAGAAWEASQFPPFVRIERWIALGPIDWRMRTSVYRKAPQTGAVELQVPLLDGEALLAGEHVVADGRITVAMQQTQQVFEWHSTLPIRPLMALHALADRPWREFWQLDVSSAWRVTFAGVPPSQMAADAPDGHVAFHPRPGETLTLTITKPRAVDGPTLAIDAVELETTAGERWRNSRLDFSYRSTRSASHVVRLPGDASLAAVSIDDATVPLPMADGELDLPIDPGEHTVSIAWQAPHTSGLRMDTPVVELGAPASNLATRLELPARWLLFATGPTLGPAVLYWSELIALVVASILLGRFRATPLRWQHWLLLGLGFSTSSWLAFALVAVWLLAHGTRATWSAGLSRLLYNASQIGVGLLTLIAFGAILAGIQSGLLGSPDMSVTGFESSARQLSWFADKTDGAMPQAAVWSLPMWAYKALILAWALWLSFALMRWLPWVWRSFADGGLWRAKAAAEDGGTKKAAAAEDGGKTKDAAPA